MEWIWRWCFRCVTWRLVLPEVECCDSCEERLGAACHE